MNKITFMGAGSTVFARNVLGDCMCIARAEGLGISPCTTSTRPAAGGELRASFDRHRTRPTGGHARITKPIWAWKTARKPCGARDFVVNAIQVGLYDPCTIIDFEVPKKYGLRQTIGDTLGIGGIMRALRTIPVMEDFAEDMEEVCPDALFLNYTNPMAMLTGYMQRYTGVKTVGLCHSVQVCSETPAERAGHGGQAGRPQGADRRHQPHGLAAGDRGQGRQRPVPRDARSGRRREERRGEARRHGAL